MSADIQRIRLQPAVQNLLQRVVRFFHPRSSCPTLISADVCGGRKSLVKPVTWQNISSCSVLSSEIVMHDDAYVSGRSENNIKCVVHDDLGWKNRTTLYILPCHWLYEWFSQFRRCGTCSVLSRSPSIVCDFGDIEMIALPAVMVSRLTEPQSAKQIHRASSHSDRNCKYISVNHFNVWDWK